jgi:VIT1/CCC1 family predicted Fe2+/Mn2+ transporter
MVFFGQTHSQAGLGVAATYSDPNFNKRWPIAVNRGLIRQREAHRSERSGRLRAAVLGSDDAIVSTASLMIGVAAASASKQAILIAGVAGRVAGSISMAVGEYVSVSAQRDSEQADIELEQQEHRALHDTIGLDALLAIERATVEQ